MGKLLCRISLEEARDTNPSETRPADLYAYGHENYYDLLCSHVGTDRIVVPVQILTIRREFAPGGWSHYWGTPVYRECLENDMFLTDVRSHMPCQFKWFGQPYFPNWCKVNGEIAERWAGYLLGHHPYLFWLDQIWKAMSNWMFLDDTMEIGYLADYDPMAYVMGLQRFLSALGHDRVFCTNGENSFIHEGYPVMYENIDTRDATVVDYWQNVARCMAWEKNIIGIHQMSQRSQDLILNIWHPSNLMLDAGKSPVAEDFARAIWHM